MKKEEVRRDYPECCAIADKFRAVFGNQVKLIYAKENGMEIGKRGEPGVMLDGISGNIAKTEGDK